MKSFKQNFLIISFFNSRFKFSTNNTLKDIPLLSEFLKTNKNQYEIEQTSSIKNLKPYSTNEIDMNYSENNLKGKRFYLETFGCQMNTNDSEIVRSILIKENLIESEEISKSDIILINTCSIRESAEDKVTSRINMLQKSKSEKVLGVLGCMAERKKDLIKGVDLIAGPDSYRDLPKMLSSLIKQESEFEINTQLSVEETYGDILPVRQVSSFKAFVSIMRGCNNMCSFCVVPFTRGQERSRDLSSILKEVESLSNKDVKDITLLGQNVNSYIS